MALARFLKITFALMTLTIYVKTMIDAAASMYT